MDYKHTSIKAEGIRLRGGFILAEMLVGLGVAALLFLTLTAFSMFCSHSFAALYNYVDLDDVNRIAIDQLTRDVRQADCVTYYNTNGASLTLKQGINSVNYAYNPSLHTLIRTLSGPSGSDVKTILTECDQLSFWIGQRNTDVGGYDVFQVATTLNTAKVINVKWVCSRSIFGQKENTESVQTARIVIRKQAS